MFTRLDTLFRSKLDEVVFIELKPTAKADINGKILDPNIPLPVMFSDVIDKVKGVSATDITAANMIKGMAFVTAIDEDFPHKVYYHDIMLAIDDKIGLFLLKHAFDLANSGNKSNALVYFKASLMFIDNEVDVLINYGRCLIELAYEQEETEMVFVYEAKEVFESLMKKYPEEPHAYYHMGYIFSNENEYKRAEEVWIKAIKLNIGENEKHDIVTKLTDLNAKIKFEEGHTFIIDGRVDEGLELLLTLEPEYLDWWNLMFFIGLGYRMNNDYDNALKYFAKVMELNTGHVQTYNEIGLCYMTMGRFGEATKAFKEALKMDRDNAEILCNLGIVHIQLDELDEAEQAFMQSFKKDPNDEITASWIKKLNELRLVN